MAKFFCVTTSLARYTSLQVPCPISFTSLNPFISSPEKLISFALIRLLCFNIYESFFDASKLKSSMTLFDCQSQHANQQFPIFKFIQNQSLYDSQTHQRTQTNFISRSNEKISNTSNSFNVVKQVKLNLIDLKKIGGLIYLFVEMYQAPIRLRRIDNKQRNSDKTTGNLELPKIASKVEEANSFLANPLQLSEASEIEGGSSELVNLMKQPWFDSGDETPAVKQQKAIKQQIADILGSGPGEDTEASAAREAEEMSPQRIISKMKKYQPINSSFSLIYGEKRTIQQHSNRPEMLSTLKRRKILNLPALNLRGQSTHSRVQLQQHIHQLYSQRQARSPNTKPQKFTNFINKIKQIYNQGNELHHKSQNLINRIDKVSAFLGQKFDRFDEQSYNMLADVGTYHLQEETSGEYKKMMMEGLSRRLRK